MNSRILLKRAHNLLEPAEFRWYMMCANTQVWFSWRFSLGWWMRDWNHEQGLCEQALEVFKSMELDGAELNLPMLNLLINAFSVAGRHLEAFSVFDYINEVVCDSREKIPLFILTTGFCLAMHRNEVCLMPWVILHFWSAAQYEKIKCDTKHLLWGLLCISYFWNRSQLLCVFPFFALSLHVYIRIWV